MSIFKILWIDDKWSEMSSFKELCEQPTKDFPGFEVVPCTNAEEGMNLFENLLEEWSGVILDAKVFKTKGSQVDNLAGLSYSINRINQLSLRREVPYYIFTGQPDTASGTTFAEEHEGHYYEKDKDEDRLIADIVKNAGTLLQNQIIHRHQVVFDTWPDSRHDLLRILKVLEDEDWQNNSVLNDIRKIMSDVVNRMFERGLLLINHNGTDLAKCSKELGQPYMEKFIPIYVQRAIHTCVAVTNPGSHRSDIDKDVMNPDGAPYLLRSLIYNMLDILYWSKNMPRKQDRLATIQSVASVKAAYQQSKQQKNTP